MFYRGFNIDLAITRDDDRHDAPVECIQFVISESIAGFDWQEVGKTEDIVTAVEMIDRLVIVREALANEIGHTK